MVCYSFDCPDIFFLSTLGLCPVPHTLYRGMIFCLFILGVNEQYVSLDVGVICSPTEVISGQRAMDWINGWIF